jgi:hypothetical protein
MLEVGHTTHFGVVNPTPLQVQSPKSNLDYNPRKMIKVTLWTIAHTRSDIERWLHFMREHGISRPHEEVETMVLTNSEGEDEYNLHFLQALKQVTTLMCHK